MVYLAKPALNVVLVFSQFALTSAAQSLGWMTPRKWSRLRGPGFQGCTSEKCVRVAELCFRPRAA